MTISINKPANYKGQGSYHTIKDDFDPNVDEIAENPDLIAFTLQGHHGEIPIEYTVPLDQALEAVVQFCRSQGCPTLVRWDID